MKIAKITLKEDFNKETSVSLFDRDVAQLVERAHGVREVARSSRVIPTSLNVAIFAGSLFARSPRLLETLERFLDGDGTKTKEENAKR